MPNSRLCIWEPGDGYDKELEERNSNLPIDLEELKKGFAHAEALAKEHGHPICFWSPDGIGALGSIASLACIDGLGKQLQEEYGYGTLDIVCCDATWGKLVLAQSSIHTAPRTRQ